MLEMGIQYVTHPLIQDKNVCHNVTAPAAIWYLGCRSVSGKGMNRMDMAFPSPCTWLVLGRRQRGTCHRQRQNGNTQGQAAWGEAGWQLLDARRGRTGASPSEGGCCWRDTGWGPHCWATHMLASWQLSSNRATTAKHSVPWQHKVEVLQDVEIKDLSTLLPLPF